MNKKSFTMADRRSSRFHISNIQRKAVAFTMAEILLSLTIIGVVAAITLPSLTGNINERTWNTQRKALYARMSQAVALMGNLNGYGIGATESETASNAAKIFVTNGLAKVYKINNICDSEHLKDCGFPEKITVLKWGSQGNSKLDAPTKLTELNNLFNYSAIGSNINYSQINTNTAAFETANGETLLTFYNPTCGYTLASPALSFNKSLLQPTMCLNFIYDLNGVKGPNAIGKDMGFMTVFYPTDSVVVAPIPLKDYFLVRESQYPEFNTGAGNAVCRKYDSDSKMANIEELKSIFINQKLARTTNTGYMSSTPASATTLYSISMWAGSVLPTAISYGGLTQRNIMCVKR